MQKIYINKVLPLIPHVLEGKGETLVDPKSILILLYASYYKDKFAIMDNTIKSLRLVSDSLVSLQEFELNEGCKFKKEMLNEIDKIYNQNKKFFDELIEKFNRLQQQYNTQKFTTSFENDLNSVINQSGIFEQAIKEIRNNILKEIDKNDTVCTLHKLSIWNSLMKGNGKSELEVPISILYYQEDIKKNKWELIKNYVKDFKNAIEELSDQISKVNNKSDTVIDVIQSIEPILLRLYKSGYVLNYLYKAYFADCSKSTSIEKEFEKELNEFLYCIFSGKILTECFKNADIEKRFNKIVSVKNFRSSDPPKKLKFTLDGLLEFLNYIFSRVDNVIETYKGFYIDYSKTCENMLTDENLQEICDKISKGSGREWRNSICPNISAFISALGNDNFRSALSYCSTNKCITRQDAKRCEYNLTVNNPDCNPLPNIVCRYVVILIMGGCTQGLDEETVRNNVLKCCELLNSDLSKRCRDLSANLPPQSIQRFAGDVYIKTHSTKIDFSAMMQELFANIFQDEFEIYKLNKLAEFNKNCKN
jgi:DNA-binding ferritin-like protein